MTRVSAGLPVFGICGWSGSGKTGLLVELVRHFTGSGLRVAVIKHDVHGVHLDREGKDSDRLFRAGADVLFARAGEKMTRVHATTPDCLEEAVNRLDLECDLVFVEGAKSANLARKIWLLRSEAEEPPLKAPGISRVLGPNEDRVGIVTAMVQEWLAERARATPLSAGILIGGRAQRMGRPKHLFHIGETTWLEHIVATVQAVVAQVALLGGGEVPENLGALPRLLDVLDRQGPLAGMLSAMRWRPDASWLFIACDLPQISLASVRWLLDQRAPGVRAVLPRLPGAVGVEPLLAFYDFRARPLLESSLAPSDLARLPGVITPEPPLEIAGAWVNMNTPTEAACFLIPNEKQFVGPT